MKRFAVIVLVFACGGKKDSGEGGGGGGGGGGAVTSDVPAEAEAFMPKDASAAWQGAWITRMTLDSKLDFGNRTVALDIKGDGAKAFDGKTEHPLGFTIASPCHVEFKQSITEGSFKGGWSTHTKEFLVKDGKLLAGDGAVGIRKGKAAVVCTVSGMDKLTTLDDKGNCKAWSHNFEKWTSKPAKCAWGNEGGKDVLTVGEGTWAHKLVADGDFLMDQQFADELKDNKHAKAASYEAAKQAVTDNIKKNDPGEQAKAAGGKVGETGNVLGLIATWSADRKSIEGKTIELTGLAWGTGSLSKDGKTTYSLTLIGSKETSAKLRVSCQTAETDSKALSFKQEEPVTVKGVVKESFGKVGLEDCAVSKK